MVTEVGLALIEKPGVAPGTVSVTVVVCTMVPLVPVTVMGYVPAATVPATEMDIAEVQLGLPVTVEGLNETVTPEGWPEAVSTTEEPKPLTRFTVMVDAGLAELPGRIEADVGEAERVKLGTGGPVRAAMSAVCGLPQPVTRS